MCVILHVERKLNVECACDIYNIQISRVTQYLFGFNVNPSNSEIFDISYVCGQQSNTFFSSNPTMKARCDLKEGGGWTVILRRNSDAVPHVNFRRIWSDYENGFGNLSTEFWYGLRNIHCLTTREPVDLRIELKQSAGTQVWTYREFVVDGAHNNYTLHIGRAHGQSEGEKFDAMAIHNGMQFTTKDVDNDKYSSNCAVGGWWYNTCGYSRLTSPHTGDWVINWHTPGRNSNYYPYVEMKVRPKGCNPNGTCK